MSDSENTKGKPVLSKPEVQVITLLLQGLSNKEIAGELGVSLATIKMHMKTYYVEDDRFRTNRSSCKSDRKQSTRT